MANIGVSPLGLTLNTTPGKSPTVGSYQKGVKMKNSKGEVISDNKSYVSLFRNNSFAVNAIATDDSGMVSSTYDTLHNDEIYNTSIISILTETSKQQSTALSAADFAYLKNLGVFPNNRLMVARRFPAPIGNDLTSIRDTTPLSTLISWVPDGDNFIDMSFGEVWEDNTEGNFESVLNDIGKGVLGGDNKGEVLGTEFYKGFNSIPLAGFMEALQYKVLERMGLTDPQNAKFLPGGNPNLIRKSVTRRLVKDGRADSGLKCTFSIKMTVEYELKFIDGVDPTLAYFDIITNILSFATSNSVFQFNDNFANKNNKLLQKFVSGDVTSLLKGLSEFAGNLISAITELVDSTIKKLSTIFKEPEKKPEAESSGVDALRKGAEKILNGVLGGFIKGSVGKFINKFRVRILAIINALTGTPSAPWHITIGNPKRPIFSSGDMYMDEIVKLELGPILQFNDLPSSIKCTFTLKNARPLGAQEIYDRFNNGQGRTYKRLNISVDDFESRTIAGTQSTDDITLDDTEHKRDQFGKSKETDGGKGAKDAQERTGQSGPVVEIRSTLPDNTGTNVPSITITPPELLDEEDIPEVPLISVEYTYNATLIGNDLFRVTVGNNFKRPTIEFIYTISEAFDTNSAIILAKNIMDSTGTYNNGIKYPKTGTKINPN